MREGALTDDATGAYEKMLLELEKESLTRANSYRASFLPDTFLSELKGRYAGRRLYWTGLALRKVREHKERKRTTLEPNQASAPEALEMVRPGKVPYALSSWQQVEIVFLSDERVQILIDGKVAETLNYAEFGLQDGRSKKPNLAWTARCALAQQGGTISRPIDSESWPSVERRMQELRKKLKDHFCLSDDPLPFVEGIGYQAQFKITLGKSFES